MTGNRSERNYLNMGVALCMTASLEINRLEYINRRGKNLLSAHFYSQFKDVNLLLITIRDALALSMPRKKDYLH